MPDMEREARYRQQYRKWQDASQAKNDDQNDDRYIASAIAISHYVDNASLANMHLELNADSPIYKGFNHRNLGALLYGALALTDYYKHCKSQKIFTNGEQKLVTNLIATMVSIFKEPRRDSAAKFQRFLLNANLWLDSNLLKTSDPVVLKKTLFSINIMLKFFDTKLANLKPAELLGLYWANINYEESKAAIIALRNKTERKIADLEPGFAPQSTIDAQPTGPKTIEAFYDAHFLEIVTNTTGSLPEKLAQVSSHLNRSQEVISELIAAKARTESIQLEIDRVLRLSDAIDQNEQKVIGKKYAFALINDHRTSFNELLSHATEDEKADWQARLTQMESPDRTRFTKDIAQYTLSWVTFLPTAAYRMLAPQSLKNRLDGYFSLSTFDGECKVKLRLLAAARLAELQDPRIASNTAKESIATQLAEDNPPIKALFLAATTQQLEELVATHRKIQQIVADYAAFCTLVSTNQEKLNQARGLNIQLDTFINTHNSFWVQLSLFFSKISELFITADAAKVQAVQAMKSKLTILEKNYENSVTEGLKEISGNTTISTEIRASILSQLSPTQHPAVIALRPKNIITDYQLVKTMFSELSNKVPESGTQEENNIDAMRI